jgi:2-polyprenyl-6-methoxyphenol hydroxylase-like FAD-dependent oxidoreductase
VSDVLIIGAGPTGLVLALWLTRHGVRVRIVDKAPEPGQASRAVAVQSRTLELYRQVDLATAVVERGLPFAAANLWIQGKRRGRMEFGSLGQGLSPFPYMLMYPQDEHERLLGERLASLGVHVERSTELVGLERHDGGVTARLARPDGSVETCTAPYLAGCDGARSFVRTALDLDFPGGTYGHLFYVADVEGTGPQMNGEFHGAFDDSDFVAVFPLKGEGGRGRGRLIGTVREDAVGGREQLDWSDVDKRAVERIHLKVSRVHWFSTYRVHHRVASAFRVNRVFILGDAAHIHSPVGGQGMNTGIGDAVNLAWKIAATLKGGAEPRILDSFEQERAPFARRLVQTTDRAFELVSADGPLAKQVRLRLAPHLITTAWKSAALRRFLYKTLSQIQIRYRASSLSEGSAGRVHGGDRLPWIPRQSGDNFDALRSLAWQVHVYGEASSALRRACDARKISVEAFAWTYTAARAGLARDAAYLVRPDGYVGLAALGSDAAAAVERYLDARGITPGR